MTTFPDYAKILLAGFTETPDYGVLRDQMDDGLAQQRSRYSTPIITRDATIYVDSLADKKLFDAWFGTELVGGAGWFTWTDPLTSTAKQTRIVSGQLKWTSPGVIWLAQVQIETIG